MEEAEEKGKEEGEREGRRERESESEVGEKGWKGSEGEDEV